MFIPDNFSIFSEPLVRAGYLSTDEVERACLNFLKTQSSLISTLETIADKPLPPILRRYLLTNIPRFASLSLAQQLIKAHRVNVELVWQAWEETIKGSKSFPHVLQSLTNGTLEPEWFITYKQNYLQELEAIYKIPHIDPSVTVVDTATLADFINNLISIDICRLHKIIPISMAKDEDSSLIVAMVDPEDLQAEDDIYRILRPKGIKVQKRLITQEDYEILLEKYYDDQTKKKLELEAKSNSPKQSSSQNEPNGLQTPIIILANRIMMKAWEEGATEIHLEPQKDHLRIRFRKNGLLQQGFDNLPKDLINVLAGRFKILANLDNIQRSLPQNGKLEKTFGNTKVAFRVSTLPSRYGERVNLRIIQPNTSLPTIEKCVVNSDTLKTINELINRPSGLIVLTGMVGSGKSTTAYALLAKKNNSATNISTVENLIEYSLPGITQVEVNPKKGLDYPSVIQSFLLQEANVILVGEIQDPETVQNLVKAVQKGCLVIATIDAKDEFSVISYLQKLEIDSVTLSRILIGVINQRLVRSLCHECRIPYHPNTKEIAKFGISNKKLLYKAHIETKKDSKDVCKHCQGWGYDGQIPVYEVLEIGNRIRGAIAEQSNISLLQHIVAQERGMSLWSYAQELVRKGLTTLDELVRVFPEDVANVPHMSSSNNAYQRIEQVEKLLTALVQEVQQLKIEVESHQIKPNSWEEPPDPWND